MCIGEETQKSIIKTNKQPQFLGKDDLKKQMIKNKSLSLKLRQKKDKLKKNIDKY